MDFQKRISEFRAFRKGPDETGYPKKRNVICRQKKGEMNCTCELSFEFRHADHIKHFNQWSQKDTIIDFVNWVNTNLMEYVHLYGLKSNRKQNLDLIGTYTSPQIDKICHHFNSLMEPVQNVIYVCHILKIHAAELGECDITPTNLWKMTSKMCLSWSNLWILHHLISLLELISAAHSRESLEIRIGSKFWWTLFCSSSFDKIGVPRKLRRPIYATVEAIAANMHLFDFLSNQSNGYSQIKINVLPIVLGCPRIIRIRINRYWSNTYIEYTPNK